jgi:hypothetical protein
VGTDCFAFIEVLAQSVTTLVQGALPWPARIWTTRAIDVLPKTDMQRSPMRPPRLQVVSLGLFRAPTRLTPWMSSVFVAWDNIKIIGWLCQSTLCTWLRLHTRSTQCKGSAVYIGNVAGFTCGVIARGVRAVLDKVSERFLAMTLRAYGHVSPYPYYLKCNIVGGI